jgi:hypothetical protein
VKVTLPIVLAMAFLAAAPASTRVTHLLGCADPATTSAALEKTQRSWQQLSATRVKQLWPEVLGEEKCTNDDGSGCRVLRTQDRTKNHDFGCGVAFAFRTDRTTEGSSSEYLERIFVHYSAAKKEDAIAASRMFARGLGVPEKKIATLGQELRQSFEWSAQFGGVRQSYSGEIDLRKNGDVWSLFLTVSAAQQ